jgi:hypothetical protein
MARPAYTHSYTAVHTHGDAEIGHHVTTEPQDPDVTPYAALTVYSGHSTLYLYAELPELNRLIQHLTEAQTALQAHLTEAEGKVR